MIYIEKKHGKLYWFSKFPSYICRTQRNFTGVQSFQNTFLKQKNKEQLYFKKYESWKMHGQLILANQTLS